jgi:hypothetical protein
VRTATYALCCAAPTAGSLRAGASHHPGVRGRQLPAPQPPVPQPPVPQPPALSAVSGEQPRSQPRARARRAHQTCSTFSQPPPAVTLPPSVYPGPCGPAKVAITTGRNAPTYTKPARPNPASHAAPGRAPRPRLPRGGRTRTATPRPPDAPGVLTMSGMVRSSRSGSGLPPALCAPRPPEDAAWARLSCHK